MIINYWNNLNERERWLTGIGSVITLIYLFYLLIYSPLTTSVNDKSKQLIEKQQTLSWMQQVRQLPLNKKTKRSISNTKLLTVIGNQLNEKNFQPFPYQLQLTGPGDIQLSFEHVPYKQLLLWLWTLNNDYAITLKQFTADRSETAGVIKLLIVITTK